MQSFLTRCKRNPHDVALFGLCQIGILLVTKRINNEINLLTEFNSVGNLLRFECFNPIQSYWIANQG